MDKKTVWLLYDADTALGINNEGELVFPYDLEDTDDYGTKEVFNGKESVLWNNVRKMFRTEIRSMYQDLRNSGALTYDKVERMFEEHQDKWPEAIFNEDAWFKYLAPLVEKGNGSYLKMIQGSKESQRKWWLYNRFQYIDSKYNAGDALAAYIELRGYAKANITVTPYASIYPTILYGSSLVQVRGKAGQSYEMICPLDTMNDTEIAIYSAPQIKSVGDLSPLLVGRANFSAATKIQDIKLGDGAAGYRNENLTYLTLGNNVMLKSLDVRNCPSLTDPIDASHCINIETVFFDGTSITGMSLPNGGVLKTLHLPGTLANLTILNQKLIEDFVLEGYENLTTVRLENVSDNIPTIDILESLPANSRVRIIGFTWEVADTDEIETLYNKFDTFRGLDENGNTTAKAQLSGTIHLSVGGGDTIIDLKERYNDINIVADTLNPPISTYTITWNVNGSVAYRQTYNYKDTPKYPGENPELDGYVFYGWNPNVSKVTSNKAYYSMFITDIPTSKDVSGAYGIELDYNKSTNNISRVGLASGLPNPSPATSLAGNGSSPFDEIYPWSEMKEYNFDNGVKTYQKGDEGFSYTDYDTAVYIPTFYYTCWKDEANGKYTWAISPTQKEGYVKHPGSGNYVSKYHINEYYNGKPYTELMYNVKFSDINDRISNNGKMLDYATLSAIQMLFVIEFASFDAQTALGLGYNTNGMRTEGQLNTSIYHTIKANNSGNKYRQIECLFSNLYQFINGVEARNREIYINVTPKTYNNDNYYVDTGVSLSQSNATIRGFAYSDKAPWAFLPEYDKACNIDDAVFSADGTRKFAMGGYNPSQTWFGLFTINAQWDKNSKQGVGGSRIMYYGE